VPFELDQSGGAELALILSRSLLPAPATGASAFVVGLELGSIERGEDDDICGAGTDELSEGESALAFDQSRTMLPFMLSR
jgi:hypothetical protein